MRTPEEIATTPSVSVRVPQLSDRFVTGLCALTWLNVNAGWSAFTGAALHWESVLHAETPDRFVKRQVDVMPWLAARFAEYTRAWIEIALETAALRDANSNDDDGHPLQAGAIPTGVSAGATAVEATMDEAEPLPAQADDGARAERQVREMTRAVLARAAKAASDSAKR